MPLLQKPLLVAVVGATGTQGSATLDALIDRNYSVRALTRTPNSNAAQALRRRGIAVCYADLSNPPSLLRALKGVDTVFVVTTPFGTSPETETAQGIAVIKAAQQCGVKHVVYTSAANADLVTGIPHFDSKYRIEQYLQQSSLSWTIIGPAAFMDDFLHGWYKRSLDQGKLTMVMPPKQKLPFICSKDIGTMAALAIDQPERFLGKRIDIAGDCMSGIQIAELFTQKLGRTIVYEEIPLKVAEQYSHDLAAMFRYFQCTGLQINKADLHAQYPEVGWHTFSEWLTSTP